MLILPMIVLFTFHRLGILMLDKESRETAFIYLSDLSHNLFSLE